MPRKSAPLVTFLVLFFTLILVGCSAGTGTQDMKIDSGVINQEYNGILKPSVPKEFKLTEQEKREGIKKYAIEATPKADPGEATTKALTGSEVRQPSGGDQVAKPKI